MRWPVINKSGYPSLAPKTKDVLAEMKGIIDMNWIDAMENRRRLIVSGILIISAACLIVSIFRYSFALDSFWHLQMGKDWIENGLSPWVDHYSFTFLGHPIANPPVAFQALLHFLVSNFGLHIGFILVKVLAYGLTLGAVVYLLRQQRASALLYAMVLPLVIFLLQSRSIVRPEIFSYAFSVVALILYFRAEGETSRRTMLPVVALMLLWTNYHSSIIGYVIFAGMFLDSASQLARSRARVGMWSQWLGWGTLVLLVGFLNADVSHPLVAAITFPSEWKWLIREYFPPRSLLTINPAAYIMVLVAIITPILAVKQRRFGLLMISLVLTYAGVTMQRMFTPGGIVITLIMAYLLAREGFPRSWALAAKRQVIAAGLLSAVIIGAAVLGNVDRALKHLQEDRSTYMRYPEALVDYMMEENIQGRIFNDYGLGGYLIYKLAPKSQVYIDGRTQILYPIEHMHAYERARRSPEALGRELEKYGFELVLLEYSQTFHDIVMETGAFDLDFMDAYHALYRGEGANFPQLGRIMAQPACWSAQLHSELESERRKMDLVLPPYSGLYPFANFVIGYGRAQDPIQFLDRSIEVDEWSDEMRRFAAYRFFEAGELEIARLLFAGIEVKKPEDYLAPAMATAIGNQWELASQILSDLARQEWNWIKPGDVLVNYVLLADMAEHRTPSTGEQARLEQLDSRLTESGVLHRDIEFNPTVFCR